MVLGLVGLLVVLGGSMVVFPVLLAVASVLVSPTNLILNEKKINNIIINIWVFCFCIFSP